MKDAIRKIKKYKVSSTNDAGETEKALVVVEAVNEDEAATRATEVSSVLSMPVIFPTLLAVEEYDGPLYLPFFAEGYFLVLEAMRSTHN